MSNKKQKQRPATLLERSLGFGHIISDNFGILSEVTLINMKQDILDIAVQPWFVADIVYIIEQ